jgi:hypothetical protein
MCTDKSGNFLDIVGEAIVTNREISTEGHQRRGQDAVRVADRHPDAHLAHVNS